jgi:hypothetical protein
MLLFFFLQFLFGDQEKIYQRKQYDDYTLYFAYEIRDDSVYFVGYVLNKSGMSVYNVNIYEEKSLVGTVPNLVNDKFMFQLPLTGKKGRIVFDKPGVFRFYHTYRID